MKAIVLILPLMTSIGKRVFLHYSDSFIPFEANMAYAKIRQTFITHFMEEPQIYVLYALTSSLFVYEQMLSTLSLHEV